MAKTTRRHGVADIDFFVLKWGDHGWIVDILHEVGKSQRLVTVLAVDSVELHGRPSKQCLQRELRVHPGCDRESAARSDQVVKASFPEVPLQRGLREGQNGVSFPFHVSGRNLSEEA